MKPIAAGALFRWNKKGEADVRCKEWAKYVGGFVFKSIERSEDLKGKIVLFPGFPSLLFFSFNDKMLLKYSNMKERQGEIKEVRFINEKRNRVV